MNREQAITYLRSSGMSEEQIRTIEDAFKPGWIPVSERLPDSGNEVLCYVANKTHPERKCEYKVGLLQPMKGDDGSGNFWNIEIPPSEWTLWGWSYFNEPEVLAWMPLPEPYRAESEGEG